VSITARTGRTCAYTCALCGVGVEHIERQGLGGTPPYWKPVPHAAPCGRPCFAAGVQGREALALWKAGGMHTRGCEECERLKWEAWAKAESE